MRVIACNVVDTKTNNENNNCTTSYNEVLKVDLFTFKCLIGGEGGSTTIPSYP